MTPSSFKLWLAEMKANGLAGMGAGGMMVPQSF